MKTIASYAIKTGATGRFGTLFLAVLALTACQQIPQKVVVDFAEPKVSQMPLATPVAAKPSTGSLFQNVGYRPAFEDRRARSVATPSPFKLLKT